MGCGMNPSNMHSSELEIVLDTVFKLDWQKSKGKEFIVVSESTLLNIDLTWLIRRLKHGSS